MPSKDSALSEETHLLALFNMRKEVNLESVEKYLGVSRNTATRKLNKLIQAGKIQRVGKGPAVKYVLT